MPASDYKPSDTLKTHKKCTMCKKTLPVENFSLATKQGHRRGKCKPCQIEHTQRSKGTWEEYQKEQSYREELHLLQKKGKRRCRLCSEMFTGTGLLLKTHSNSYIKHSWSKIIWY